MEGSAYQPGGTDGAADDAALEVPPVWPQPAVSVDDCWPQSEALDVPVETESSEPWPEPHDPPLVDEPDESSELVPHDDVASLDAADGSAPPHEEPCAGAADDPDALPQPAGSAGGVAAVGSPPQDEPVAVSPELAAVVVDADGAVAPVPSRLR